MAVTLALPTFCVAAVADNGDVSRAATRRTSAAATPQTSRTRTQTPASNISSRATTVQKTGTTPRTTTARPGGTVRENMRGDTATPQKSVSARTTTNVMPRTIKTSASAKTTARTAILPRATASSVTKSARTTRMATSSRATRTARAATSDASDTRERVTASDVINHDASKCRTVYYECMDEFCANKDAQLKRCACSTNINRFDKTKQNLAEIDEKMLDFNQRLLTVNMDKEDAAVLNQATEGELAFNQKDQTTSKKILDEIASKLNTSFDTSNFNTDLVPISLSLNTSAAFDSVDSLAGSATTSKSGTDLYSAALPVCREMAREVCSTGELDIVEGGYQMLIEQDCNTVTKNYQAQVDAARERVHEGGALLDMSRLNIHQQRNSDDILTCKRKMLTMLTDSTVCGTNLGKCLDTTGQYIDPSTGQAFLTVSLANLSNLITRPGPDQTWTGAPGNSIFVSFLNSKRKFLEPAMEKCQNISDQVWDDFIEDALAQIKLAQEAKLEEVRQSCTTLNAQCLKNASDSLEDFDARALSTFGVAADKTAQAMCADVRTACTALMGTTGDTSDWIDGVTEITANKTYETILSTCREVGRACIIQACKSISSNFGLCENIDSSINRKAIINRTACWDEVKKCVADAGDDAINQIFDNLMANGTISTNISQNGYSFYGQLYGSADTDHTTLIELTNPSIITQYINTKNDGVKPDVPLTEACYARTGGRYNNSNGPANCVFDICETECSLLAEQAEEEIRTSDGKKETIINRYYSGAGFDTKKCMACRLAERIWGNCEASPDANMGTKESHNKIKIPIDDSETLLSWFAKNTNTTDALDSCRDTSCGIGFIAHNENGKTVCRDKSDLDSAGNLCTPTTHWAVKIASDQTNCCSIIKNGTQTPGYADTFGNCCLLGETQIIDGINLYKNYAYTPLTESPESDYPIPENFGTGNVPNITTPGANGHGGLCVPSGSYLIGAFPSANLTGADEDYYDDGGLYYIICTGTFSGANASTSYPSGQNIKCDGDIILVSQTTGKYISPKWDVSGNQSIMYTYDQPWNYYYASTTSNIRTEQSTTLNFTDTGINNENHSGWHWHNNNTGTTVSTTPDNWLLLYSIRDEYGDYNQNPPTSADQSQ